MWASLLGILASPVFNTILAGYKAKLASGDEHARLSADLAAREMAVQVTELKAQQQLKIAEIGRWYEPEKLFAYIVVIYFGKCLLWDKVLGHITHGSTDPLGGDIAQWAGMVMTFYLGRRGFENVVRILKR